MPPGWAHGRPPRVRVGAKVGGRSSGGLGFEALLDFDVALAIDGEPLTKAETKALLKGAAGLRWLRGRWIEVDPTHVAETLARYESVHALAAKGGLTFAEALRIDRVRLLLDEPGLGKTVTGAACLAMRDAINGEHRPAIVVCPSSVRATWRAELAKWAPDLTVILPDDVASIRAPGPGEVVVLGHDQLGCLRPPKVPPPTAPQKARDAYAKAKTLHDKRAAAIDSLKRLAPHTDLVVDEAQYAKGAASARSLVLESLWKTGCRTVGGVLWILTGTIDPCSPLDLFVVLEVAGIANRIWPGGLVEFAAHFGGTYHSRGNRWDFPELPPGGSVLQLSLIHISEPTRPY